MGVEEFVDCLFLLNKISWRGILEFLGRQEIQKQFPTKRGERNDKRLRWGWDRRRMIGRDELEFCSIYREMTKDVNVEFKLTKFGLSRKVCTEMTILW